MFGRYDLYEMRRAEVSELQLGKDSAKVSPNSYGDDHDQSQPENLEAQAIEPFHQHRLDRKKIIDTPSFVNSNHLNFIKHDYQSLTWHHPNRYNPVV